MALENPSNAAFLHVGNPPQWAPVHAQSPAFRTADRSAVTTSPQGLLLVQNGGPGVETPGTSCINLTSENVNLNAGQVVAEDH